MQNGRDAVKTVLAIPNYNMKSCLDRLLRDAVAQGYDNIVVLDDFSTDGSVDFVKDAYPEVRIVQGSHNIGSSGNRNRIFEALDSPALLHFIDADMEFLQERTASLIRPYAYRNDIGFVGGLVVAASGKQSVWNYGPKQSLYGSVSSIAAAAGEHLSRGDRPFSRKISSAVFDLLPDSPNPLAPPHRRATYWVHESNLVIRSEVLAGCGMFNTGQREHDIQPLAVRTQEAGYANIFDPSFALRQVGAPSVRNYGRLRASAQTELKLAAKNGFVDWLFPKGHMRPPVNAEIRRSPGPNP